MDTYILDQSFCAVAIIDKENQVEYCNPSFVNLMGRTSRQIKKTPDFVSLMPGLETEVRNLITSAMSTKDVQLGTEMKVDTPKGNRYFVMKVIPMKPDHDKVLICFNDVTVERSLYEKYRQMVEDLKLNHAHIVHADRLRAIGELTSNMAHEVNNPLTVAVGNAELLGFSLESNNLESERTMLIQTQKNLMDSLQRIDTIIQGMRQFAYKGETEKEYVALQDIVNSCRLFVAPMLEKCNIELVIKMPQAPVLALVEKIKIEQVLVNILTNARDALETTSNPRIILSISQDRDLGMNDITITDNGPGIDPELKEEIYKSFFSTKPQGAGTGLGLAIAKRLIEAHQGTLRHESAPGNTVFTISLPMIELSSFAEGALDNVISEDGQHSRVVIIDNEVGILNLAKNFLHKTGHRIIGSTGGEQVFALLKDFRPSLVITDLQMPDISGRELSVRLRQMYPDLPIVYMSSPEQEKIFEQDRASLKLSGFLPKPFTREKLLNVITQALEQ